MTRRYGANPVHARKIAQLAHELFSALQPLHGLAPPCGRLIEAAAYLHDTGHFINSASHHKHSYYVVATSDMAGFTAGERTTIAALCRYHRKAMPAAAQFPFQTLPPDDKRTVLKLIPLLRLADALDLSGAQRVSGLRCKIGDAQVVVELQARGNIDLELFRQWVAD